jgi:hypothetical protein
MLEARHKMKLFYPVRPWENEPDHAEWIQEPSGYRCRIKRNEITGSLCGYVGIPKEHRFWGKCYHGENEEVDAISEDVHGGLSYSAQGDDGWWYFGFDTAHADDFTPKIVEMLIGLGREVGDLRYHECMNYKTWEFVEDQIYWLGKRLWQYNEYEQAYSEYHKNKGGKDV